MSLLLTYHRHPRRVVGIQLRNEPYACFFLLLYDYFKWSGVRSPSLIYLFGLANSHQLNYWREWKTLDLNKQKWNNHRTESSYSSIQSVISCCKKKYWGKMGRWVGMVMEMFQGKKYGTAHIHNWLVRWLSFFPFFLSVESLLLSRNENLIFSGRE